MCRREDSVLRVVSQVRHTRAPGLNDSCVVKTHYPLFPSELDVSCRATRVLLLVRNPVDAIAAAVRYSMRKERVPYTSAATQVSRMTDAYA